MAKQTLHQYFKDAIIPKPTRTKMFQAWVDQNLLKQTMAQRKKDGLSWRELIESCFKLYLKSTKSE